jgi:indole-3-glycerol phosphate synthase
VASDRPLTRRHGRVLRPDVDHLASGSVTDRRLSQAIAEGDGISVLVEVGNGDAARRAEERGAEGIVVRGAHALLGEEIALPLLAYGPGPEDAAASAAAAVVVTLEGEDEEALPGLAGRCHELGLELVVRIRDDEELERVLGHLDPEILLLTAERAEPEQPALDRLLELLPDVPAGKLAIAELADASREDVEMLERAGVDAVLVTGDVEALVGDGVPDV